MKTLSKFLFILFSISGLSSPSKISFNDISLESLVKSLKSEVENSTETITLQFVHISNEKYIDSALEEKLIKFESMLSLAGVSERIDIEFEIIDQNDYKNLIENFDLKTDRTSLIQNSLKEYEEINGSIDSKVRSKITNYFAPQAVKSRVDKIKTNVFGSPNGVSFVDYFKTPKGLSQGDRALKRRKSIMMALRTAGLAVTSFSLSVAGPMGFLEFLGPEHLRSSAILGAWVFVAIRYVESLIKIKTQGKSLLMKFHKNKKRISFKTNKILYNSMAIIQEMVGTTLITAGMIGFSNLIHGGVELWLYVITSNAVLSALSSAPAEQLASRYFKSASMYFQKAEALKTKGDSKAANEFFELARKSNKSGGITLDVWWNVIFPAVKWGGIIATIGAGEAKGLGVWMLANSGLLAFASYGVLKDVYDNLPRSKYKAKKLLERLRLLKPMEDICDTQLRIRRN